MEQMSRGKRLTGSSDEYACPSVWRYEVSKAEIDQLHDALEVLCDAEKRKVSLMNLGTGALIMPYNQGP